MCQKDGLETPAWIGKSFQNSDVVCGLPEAGEHGVE